MARLALLLLGCWIGGWCCYWTIAFVPVSSQYGLRIVNPSIAHWDPALFSVANQQHQHSFIAEKQIRMVTDPQDQSPEIAPLEHKQLDSAMLLKGPLVIPTTMAYSRRRSLVQLAGVATALLVMESLTTEESSSLLSSGLANAYEREFPSELASQDEGILDSRQRKIQQILQQQQQQSSSTNNQDRQLLYTPFSVLSSQPVGTALWAIALWFLTGSRSNPLVTPLANILYESDKENWLQDRNNGLFADLPKPLFLLVLFVFVTLGFGLDTVTTVMADNSRSVSLQWACVSIIIGGFWELGRIASGEKRPTRAEFDRDDQLRIEFYEYASRRLIPGGNCHRNEVVSSFRRYYAKYRQRDSTEYPLSDLKIEQLLRQWSQQTYGIDQSSAGFYNGFQINKDADVFVRR